MRLLQPKIETEGGSLLHIGWDKGVCIFTALFQLSGLQNWLFHVSALCLELIDVLSANQRAETFLCILLLKKLCGELKHRNRSINWIDMVN